MFHISQHLIRFLGLLGVLVGDEFIKVIVVGSAGLLLCDDCHSFADICDDCATRLGDIDDIDIAVVCSEQEVASKQKERFLSRLKDGGISQYHAIDPRARELQVVGISLIEFSFKDTLSGDAIDVDLFFRSSAAPSVDSELFLSNARIALAAAAQKLDVEKIVVQDAYTEFRRMAIDAGVLGKFVFLKSFQLVILFFAVLLGDLGAVEMNLGRSARAIANVSARVLSAYLSTGTEEKITTGVGHLQRRIVPNGTVTLWIESLDGAKGFKKKFVHLPRLLIGYLVASVVRPPVPVFRLLCSKWAKNSHAQTGPFSVCGLFFEIENHGHASLISDFQKNASHIEGHGPGLTVEDLTMLGIGIHHHNLLSYLLALVNDKRRVICLFGEFFKKSDIPAPTLLEEDKIKKTVNQTITDFLKTPRQYGNYLPATLVRSGAGFEMKFGV
jgi:hypothetical protein